METSHGMSFHLFWDLTIVRPTNRTCTGFFHVMIQRALDVVRVCCIDWEMELFTYCLLYYCCTWRSSYQNSDVLITLCLYTVNYG